MYNLLLQDYAPTLEQIKRRQRADTEALNTLPLSVAASAAVFGEALLVTSASTLFFGVWGGEALKYG